MDHKLHGALFHYSIITAVDLHTAVNQGLDAAHSVRITPGIKCGVQPKMQECTYEAQEDANTCLQRPPCAARYGALARWGKVQRTNQIQAVLGDNFQAQRI